MLHIKPGRGPGPFGGPSYFGPSPHSASLPSRGGGNAQYLLILRLVAATGLLPDAQAQVELLLSEEPPQAASRRDANSYAGRSRRARGNRRGASCGGGSHEARGRGGGAEHEGASVVDEVALLEATTT
jgi:hypothetical protein